MSLTILQDGSECIGYEKPAFPVYVRPGDLKEFPNMTALCHWHEEVEILIPLRGYLSYNINGTVVTVEEGSAIFVNSRQLHFGFSADGTDCQYVCIAFQPRILCANEEVQNRYVTPLLTSQGFTHMVLQKKDPHHAPLLNVISRICDLGENRPKGHEMLLIANLHLLWYDMFLLAEPQIGEELSTDANVLIQKQMLEYIHTHYREKINLEDIAAAGGVCRTKCWQIFRKYLDQTPNEYLNSYRLEKGMQLLKSSSLRITEIAELCGFSGASYFTELFTRQKGCSPTVYRRQ